ncbi:MAG TPA: asparagine synthase B [Polyangiaceae bacterium]|jgi:asparagine synthase (glutamine-hydrolysing)|nr:asparagine synthase B [Polyangiaceae bacterium]
MCGIIATFSTQGVPDSQYLQELALRCLAHRGPDGVGTLSLGHAGSAHTRLAIVDLVGGQQPMRGEHDRSLLVCNGEIYNHGSLRERLEAKHVFRSKSDSEVVLHLYEDHGPECAAKLDGMFAFFVSDGHRFVAARDPLGIKPLYYGPGRAGGLWLASEFKALLEPCETFAALPPGSVLTERGEVTRWFRPGWEERIGTQQTFTPSDLLGRLRRSVEKRLMSDVPMGAFLSGGLDSSIVTALARPHLRSLKTFAVGLKGTPDLEAARIASHALSTKHHERTYTVHDVARHLPKIIHHLESYDAALIRSAVPCYFLAELTAEHVKVVLTGEGADELFAGYGYFKNIDDPAALHAECAGLLLGLHAMNLQRVDRMTMAHGVEARVPFLDVEFVDWAMSIAPELKLVRPGRPEKQMLREAARDLLPAEIAHRPKLEFSQGTGAGDVLSSYAEAQVSDGDLTSAGRRFPLDPPKSKEELLYRRIFDEVLPGEAARRSVRRWRGKPNRATTAEMEAP